MRLGNPEAVLEFLAAAAPAAALGAAFELGLFTELASGPASPAELSERLGTSERRCRYWLQLLAGTGLIRGAEGRWSLSPAGRAILAAYSPATWDFLAASVREMHPLFADLPARLRSPAAAWRADLPAVPDYVARMHEDPEYCEQFTRMLMELHGPLAAALAAILPAAGAERLLDLGGGSGVMSHALLRRNAGLQAVVVDIAPVCAVSERIAAEEALVDRLSVHPVADLTVDSLPGDFDLVLECDLSIHDETLFGRLRDVLRPGGRLALVDQFAPAPGVAPAERVRWRFEGALLENEFETPTASTVAGWLEKSGFRLVAEESLEKVWTLLLAERG